MLGPITNLSVSNVCFRLFFFSMGLLMMSSRLMLLYLPRLNLNLIRYVSAKSTRFCLLLTHSFKLICFLPFPFIHLFISTLKIALYKRQPRKLYRRISVWASTCYAFTRQNFMSVGICDSIIEAVAGVF